MKRPLNNPLGHLVSIMWANAPGLKPTIVLYGVMAGAAVLVSLAGPLVIARLMQAAQYKSGAALAADAWFYLSVFVLLGLTFWLFHGPSRVMETVVAFKVKRMLQIKLFQQVTELPLGWHRQHHSGKTIDQVAKASQALGDFVEGGFLVIHIATRFVGSVVVLAWIMPKAGLAVAFAGAIAAATIIFFDRRLVKLYETLNLRFNEVAAAVQDYLTNVATVISLRLEQRVARELAERTDRILPLWRRTAMTNELKWFSTSCLVDFTHGGVLLVFILVTIQTESSIDLGILYALSAYMRSVGDAFFDFTHKYQDLLVKSTRLHAIDHIDEAFEQEVRDAAEARLPIGWRRVTIQRLSFCHESGDNGDKLAGVNEVSLSLERGRSYALVGESGSGKSTVLKLLRCLHHPDWVEVACGGLRLEHGLYHVAHHATLIPQEPEIFADTIRFNVTMGVAAAEAEIRRVLQLARFESVLERLPRGLDTNVAEKGVSLSGGEKQRLAVARGLFFVKESGSEIVLLDEPTSSVDNFNEWLIYEALLQEFREHCVLSAVHKLNLLELFDEVLVFAAGRLVECGTVASLLAHRGEFARLWGSFARVNEAKVSA